MRMKLATAIDTPAIPKPQASKPVRSRLGPLFRGGAKDGHGH